jgi:hypothetical protein
VLVGDPLMIGPSAAAVDYQQAILPRIIVAKSPDTSALQADQAK